MRAAMPVAGPACVVHAACHYGASGLAVGAGTRVCVPCWHRWAIAPQYIEKFIIVLSIFKVSTPTIRRDCPIMRAGGGAGGCCVLCFLFCACVQLLSVCMLCSCYVCCGFSCAPPDASSALCPVLHCTARLDVRHPLTVIAAHFQPFPCCHAPRPGVLLTHSLQHAPAQVTCRVE